MQAILTGSQVYGTPHGKSDVDLVIRVTTEELAVLEKAADKVFICKENDSLSLHFGKLNLICVTSDRMFQAWLDGTEALIQQAPITREIAITFFASKGIKPIANMSNYRHY